MFGPYSRVSFIALFTCLTLASPLSLAGAGSGGGGDAATEMRIDEIRADLLKWISEGGARDLRLPDGLPYEAYVKKMNRLLPKHRVVIGAVTLAEEVGTQDEELKVVVNGQPKACRGFISQKDRLPHILCNAERFGATSAPEQYRLIHHEFAGLAGLEKNLGASSDYVVSQQITDYLVPETVLRLSVRKRDASAKLPTGRIPLELKAFFKTQIEGWASSTCSINPNNGRYTLKTVLEVAFDCSSDSGCVVATQIAGSTSDFVREGNHMHFLKNEEADLDLWKAEYASGTHVANIACIKIHDYRSPAPELSEPKECWLEFGPNVPETDYEIRNGYCRQQLLQQQQQSPRQ